MVELKGKAKNLYRTEIEKEVAKRYQNCWDNNNDSFGDKIQAFPKYVRRQDLTRFLAIYDIFKKVLNIKGSIIECGVNTGRGLMEWAKLSSILEPYNLFRKIYGFDTFKGFPNISREDFTTYGDSQKVGGMYSDSYGELKEIIKIYDSNRAADHVEKIFLIKGDVCKTIPKFIVENPDIIASIVFVDFQIYESTKVAIEYFYPRIPKGGIIIFGALGNPGSIGETIATMEKLRIDNLKIQRIEYEPYLSFVVKE